MSFFFCPHKMTREKKIINHLLICRLDEYKKTFILSLFFGHVRIRNVWFDGRIMYSTVLWRVVDSSSMSVPQEIRENERKWRQRQNKQWMELYTHMNIHTDGRWVSDCPIIIRTATTFLLSITYTQDAFYIPLWWVFSFFLFLISNQNDDNVPRMIIALDHH
jgi:hypothetical protein